MHPTRKPLSLMIGAAVATTALASGSAFAMQPLEAGYAVESTAMEGACGEGKCGAGKCGGNMAAKPKADVAGKKPYSLADMDTDKDGRLSRTEFAAAHGGKSDKFAAHDGNGDGFITQAEMDAAHAKMKAAKAAEGKCGEGKCGEGKCGGQKKTTP